jgi:Xaa-Pro aminopeptidase
MRRAAEISREGHAAAARLAWPGAFEYELEAALEYTFRRRGARGPAYTTIVGGGANATVLHYVRNDQKLREDELVLIDAGCELEGYASDVTRTYPVGGRFTGPTRAVYEVVLAAEQAGLDKCRPGESLPAVHDAALAALVEGMIELGILKGDPAELIAREAYKAYYMHSTSHWLGLDVHDVGSYRQDGGPRRRARDRVHRPSRGSTCGDADVGASAGSACGIEDDVVITADGHRIDSRSRRSRRVSRRS